MLVFSLNTAVTTESPWMLSERTESRSDAPFTELSTGRVTSVSTCSAERPGASVWIVTCGATNSGNTSSEERAATMLPQISRPKASAITIPRWRSESWTRRDSMLVGLAAALGFQLLAQQRLRAGHHEQILGAHPAGFRVDEPPFLAFERRVEGDRLAQEFLLL